MKALRSNRDNTCYYLALLDWRTKILKPEELYDFTDEVVPAPRRSEDGWRTSRSLSWPELNENVTNIKMGFYHSRMIFRFDLKEAPETIHEFREIRSKIEERVEDYLNKKVINAMEKYTEKKKEPRIFLYPLFEIRGREVFWKRFGKQKPYSSATTCFYTELDDPRAREWWLQLPLIGHVVSVLFPREVRVRVSGGSIVTTEMSRWFFWNLTNIIFHEGLYRQSRPVGLSEGLFETKGVYCGLENRLEDFASKLIDIFHDLSSIRLRGLIAQIALIIAIIGLLFTLVPRLQAIQILIIGLISYGVFWLLRKVLRKY